MLGALEFPAAWRNAARRAIARHQVTLAEAVAPASLVNPTTVITRAGTYQRYWHLKGIPWQTVSPEVIWNNHRTFAAWANSLPGGEWRVLRYRIQRRVTARLTPIAGACYSAHLEGDVTQRDTFLLCEHYIVLEHIPRRLRDQGGLARSIARLLGSDIRCDAQIAEDEAESLRALNETGAEMETALSAHEPRMLGEYEHCGVVFSEIAEFIGFTVNGTWARVRADCGMLPQALPAVQFSAGPGIVELAGVGRTVYAAVLDIKDYVNVEPGILNGLLLQPAEWMEMQGWEPMVRRDSVEALQQQENHLRAVEDVSVTQREEIKRAMDRAQDGVEKQGDYAYCVAVFGNTAEAALAAAARINGSVMQDARGLQLAAVRLLADDAWKLMIPGNFGRHGIQPRRAVISNEAFCALSALHGSAANKRFGHPWGEALWLAHTSSGRAYPACPHASPPGQDCFGLKLSGNMFITGKTGSGKSTFQNLLLAFMKRWSPAPHIAWLDYNRANEVFFRRIGAHYYRFSLGESSGMNPLRRPRTGYPSSAQVHEWRELVKQIIWNPNLLLLPDEEDDIATAVERVATMPAHLRSLTRIRENLAIKGRTDGRPSVYERLKPWCGGGEYAWVFDGDDTLPEPHEAGMIAFDYTDILGRPELSAPLLLALLHYMRAMLGHGRIVIGGDETWKGITNDTLAEFFDEMQRTARFQDCILIMTTQQPDDAMGSRYGRTNISQTATFVALADEMATRECYVERIGWSEEALLAIRELRRDGRLRCLWWQPSIGDPVELELPDLTGMHDHLAILSGAKENLPLLDAALAKAGSDPEAWAPLFLAAVREYLDHNHGLARRED